jgi:hypothetical protein
MNFLVGLVFKLRALHLQSRHSAAWAILTVLHFALDILEMGVSWTICLGWPQTVILLTSVSQVARITVMRYHCLATTYNVFKSTLYLLPVNLPHLPRLKYVPSISCSRQLAFLEVSSFQSDSYSTFPWLFAYIFLHSESVYKTAFFSSVDLGLQQVLFSSTTYLPLSSSLGLSICIGLVNALTTQKSKGNHYTISMKPN